MNEDSQHAIARGFELTLTNAARFSLGRVVATPAALELLERTGISPAALLARHAHGDFGDCSADDAALNELAIRDGSRILSVYRLVDAEKIRATPRSKRCDLPTVWIVTEATNDHDQREFTVVHLPSEH